jgi:hypothetical protein
LTAWHSLKQQRDSGRDLAKVKRAAEKAKERVLAGTAR